MRSALVGIDTSKTYLVRGENTGGNRPVRSEAPVLERKAARVIEARIPGLERVTIIEVLIACPNINFDTIPECPDRCSSSRYRRFELKRTTR